MPTAVNQIEPNGEIAVDFDPEQVPFEDQEQIIRDGLNSRLDCSVPAGRQGDKTTSVRDIEGV